MSEPTFDSDLSMIKSAASRLCEHFETVQIFVTKMDGKGNTVRLQAGTGNYYARYGQTRAFVLMEEQGFKEEGKDKDE